MARRPSTAFDRPHRQQKQHRLFVIVGEGARTERRYFALFQDPSYTIVYSSPRGNHGGNMIELVREMRVQQRRRSKPSASSPTEYWIVVDVERETVPRDLAPLLSWVRESPFNHLALTNRQFENWLLLHFRKGMACDHPERELGRYVNGYGPKHKVLKPGDITIQQVEVALANARSANVVISDRPTDLRGLPSYCTSLPSLVEQLMPEEETIAGR